MELDLDRQEHGRSELDISGSLTLDLGEGRPDKVALRGQLVVQNIDSRFLLNGVVTAAGLAQCGRCLQDFPLEWDAPVEMMVLCDVDSDEEEGETLLIVQRNGIVDLSESLRECTVLAFPQSLVCQEDCKGLCASCGSDRNTASCDCVQEDYDPRWAGLPE